jgi:signal peptide peptidase SppA
MRDLPHLASRLFGTPLLVDPRKLEIIVPAFLRRLDGAPDETDDAAAREPGEPVVSSGVAVIPIIGSLVRRKTAMQAFSGLTSYGDIAASLDSALEDARVRAILLQLDTFGGEAGGCFELCDKIFAARRSKPIWAVADVEALSAGYAIASVAERIYLAPSGSVGSIGVVAVHCERSQMNEAIGLTYTVFRAGARKADGNPFEPLATEAGKKLQASMDRTRDRFARSVARGRPGVTRAAAMATEGQWYDPDEALSLKLVDSIGVYETAFADLAKSVAVPARAKPPEQPPAPAEDDEDRDPGVTAQPGDITMTDEEKKAAETSAAAAAAAIAAAPVKPPATAAAPASESNVVTLDSARAAGVAEAREVAELCQLAGRPEMAATMIGKPMADVRRALLDAKAEADVKLGQVSNHQPAPLPTAAEQAVGWDRAFAAVHAQTAHARH